MTEYISYYCFGESRTTAEKAMNSDLTRQFILWYSDGPAYHIVHDRRDQLWMKIDRHSRCAGRYIIPLPLLLRNKLDALRQAQTIIFFIFIF